MHAPLAHHAIIQDDVSDAHILFRDIEARSTLSLKKAGAARYGSRPGHRNHLREAYAVDDGPLLLWRPGDPVPPEFIEAAANPSWITVAHNDAFESAIERYVLAPRYGWPLVPIERHICTQAMCFSLAPDCRQSWAAVADAWELQINRKVPVAKN